MSGTRTAFVGATGGAGTTRLGLEAAATLARDGHAVAVLDAAYATQGLADHVRGRIDADVTTLVTGEDPLDDALYDLPTDAPGSVACCPARAPFERLAQAKTPAAAERFEDLVRTAAGEFDHVLCDVPPVAANQAVAAASVADRVALVAPGDARDADAVPRMRDRLADVGVDVDATVATGTDESAVADAVVPESDVTAPGDVPVCDVAEGSFAEGVATATETACDVSLDVEFEPEGLFGR